MKVLAVAAFIPASWALFFLMLHWHGLYRSTGWLRYQLGAATIALAGTAATAAFLRWIS